MVELEQGLELKLGSELELVVLDSRQATEELAKLPLELTRARRQHESVVGQLKNVGY